VLSKAYGQFVTDTLMRPRLQRRLGQQPCPFPTLIDGKMERAEWIIGPHGLLKTDYEHHGMGKAELNLMDPAYDLAETILNFDTLTRGGEPADPAIHRGIGRRQRRATSLHEQIACRPLGDGLGPTRHRSGHPTAQNPQNPVQLRQAIYKQRNIIERMFYCFKDWRRIATRFDRNLKSFMAAIALAAIVIWWL
jgi:transposase